mmetsp:Transcript_23029/g.49858  ORF Transcript_23029/g.49858 Transcript_23029/m.49858 type:complete len:185 (+) Transcript_23029:82-636(+)|eukprot:CAMPEP_0172298556 /NCGR_PEP_ID=MMETSP1058-20130122/1159_1 /TAXON_ID=83371 /ORGANISM="Detonula confervacea, Strain CCMP 353" /LENGTH=184 /DNA_ID=CAMNT_0013007835 /DNA_START=29 /DNA_END=583 /DNA_ORIENTATION=-
MTAPAKKEETIARWKILRRLKKRLRLRRIRDIDAKILHDRENLLRPNSTIKTDISLPRSLSEALPENRKNRDEETRAFVVTECTGNFNMIGCNKAWENLCGWAESEIIGKDSSILQGPDSNYIGLRDAVQRLFEEEKPIRCVTTNYRKDGSRFKNLLSLGPIYNAHGKMTHCVAQLMNIGNVDA